MDLNLTIKEGEFVALIGQNGSGKSTFGKMLNALLIPVTGNVFIDGLDTRERVYNPLIRSQVGMIFQRPQDQIVATTVEEDIAFAPANLGLPPAEIRKRVSESLSAAGISELKSRPTYQLSAGETQRVALAGVLAMRPKCIIFDETTAMLDPAGREMVLRQAKLLKAAGITVIFITHLMEEAVQFDRILILHKGKLMVDDSPKTVFSSEGQLKKYGLDFPPAARAAKVLRKHIKSIPMGVLFEKDLFNEIKKNSYKGKKKNLEVVGNKKNNVRIVDVKHLRHIYMNDTPLAHQSLNDVNFYVNQGSTHGLIGSTGSGKSTLLQHLNSLIQPQSGTIKVLDFNLNDPNLETKSLRRSVGLVFQQPEDQIFEQYVGDEIAYAARNFAVPGKISDIVESAMQSVGLDFRIYKDRFTSTLSGGERRKVALASVLAAKPELLLLDEPLAGLDPQSRFEIANYFKELKHKGKTLVISTHQFDEIVGLMDEVSVLSKGSDFTQGAPGEVFINQPFLEKAGIKAPLIMRIVRLLRELNWPLSEGISTLSALDSDLKRIIEKGIDN